MGSAILGSVVLRFEDYMTVGGLVVLLANGLGVAVLSAFISRVDRKAGRAEKNSELAAQRTEPTGNGYAARTEASNARVEAALADLRSDVGGMRADLRATNSRLDHTNRRLDAHLDQE